MVVRIRLARFGAKRKPFYNIVIAHARTARNSKPLEVIGTYDPIPKAPLEAASTSPVFPSPSPSPLSTAPARRYKDIQLDTSRAKYWLGVGAQPSEPVWRLLGMLGLVERKLGGKSWQRIKGETAQEEKEKQTQEQTQEQTQTQ